MWTYKVVERALAETYGVVEDKVREGAFRGRLKHFQKLGIPLGRRPGRGTKLTYDPDEILQMLFCFELSGFSIEPTVSVALMEARWQDLSPSMLANFEGRDDAARYLVFSPDQATRSWSGDPRGNLDSCRFVGIEAIAGVVEGVASSDAPRLALVDVGSLTAKLRSHLGVAPRKRDVLVLASRKATAGASDRS